MEYQAALVLAATGDAPRALALANTLGKKYTEGTIVQFKEVPTVRAQIALANNDPAKAVEDLQTVTPYELGIVDHRDVETMSDLSRSICVAKHISHFVTAAEQQSNFRRSLIIATLHQIALAHLPPWASPALMYYKATP